jgi:hypothetical protein
VPGGITRSPATVDAHERAAAGFQAEVARRIEASPRKEVVLFVHGYAHSFQDAAFSMADLCHFFGRGFVCGIFTWPVGGSRGMMAGFRRGDPLRLPSRRRFPRAPRLASSRPGPPPDLDECVRLDEDGALARAAHGLYAAQEKGEKCPFRVPLESSQRMPKTLNRLRVAFASESRLATG